MPQLVKAKTAGYYGDIYRKAGEQFYVDDKLNIKETSWLEKVKVEKAGKAETENVTVILAKSPEGQLQGKTHSVDDIAGVDGDTALGGAVIDGRAHSPKPVFKQAEKEVKPAEKHDHKQDKK